MNESNSAVAHQHEHDVSLLFNQKRPARKSKQLHKCTMLPFRKTNKARIKCIYVRVESYVGCCEAYYVGYNESANKL